jgi:hypothetical protein
MKNYAKKEDRHDKGNFSDNTIRSVNAGLGRLVKSFRLRFVLLADKSNGKALSCQS